MNAGVPGRGSAAIAGLGRGVPGQPGRSAGSRVAPAPVSPAGRWQQQPGPQLAAAGSCLLTWGRGLVGLDAAPLLLAAAGDPLPGQPGWRDPRGQRGCGQQRTLPTLCGAAGVHPAPSCVASVSPPPRTCELCWGKRMGMDLGTALL